MELFLCYKLFNLEDSQENFYKQIDDESQLSKVENLTSGITSESYKKLIDNT